MDVRHACQLEEAQSGIRDRKFLHLFKARERRNRKARLRAVTGRAPLCENGFNLRVTLTRCAVAKPMENLAAFLGCNLVGHGPTESAFQPGTAGRAVVF